MKKVIISMFFSILTLSSLCKIANVDVCEFDVRIRLLHYALIILFIFEDPPCVKSWNNKLIQNVC